MFADKEKRQEYHKRYYREKIRNNPAEMARRREYNRKKGYSEARRKGVREFIRVVKEGNPCEDCGLLFPYFVMEFDHVKGKAMNLSRMASQGNSIGRVVEEMRKCDLVCANCHRVRTHKRSITRC